MRLVKIPLVGLLLLLSLSVGARADHFGCDDLTKSSFDNLRLPYFKGVPGDTVLLPIIFDNDSIVTSFQFLLQFDTTWMTPVFLADSSCAVGDSTGCIEWNVDSNFVDYIITNRMLITDSTFGEFGLTIDTVNQFTVNLFQGLKNVLAFNGIPEFLTLDSLPPGDDTIFYVKMVIKPTMPHNQLSQFSFYESDIFIVNDTTFPPDTTYFNGCNQSQMVSTWQVTPDSSAGFQIYPTTDHGYAYWFQADTSFVATDPAPGISFAASPDSIGTGSPSSLAWTSSYADSVVIRNSSGTRLTDAANGSTSGNIVFSSLVEGLFSFSATAFGSDGRTALSSATVKVQNDGGTGSGEGPSINITGLLGSYNQGELISFTATATNSNGSQISLAATSLPANAGFATGGQVLGYSPLSGNFSWTPDFNQQGSFVVRFVATDLDGTTERYVTLQVQALQFDRLFSTSRVGNRPVGGLPGREGILFPIDLVTSQTVYGVQFDMSYPSNIVTVDSFVTSARIPDYVVYDNVGLTPGEIRVVTFGLANEPVNDTNTTAILFAALSLDSAAIPWTDYTIILDNGRESVNPDPNVGSLPLVTDSGLVAIDSLGDVNLDRSIDVGDAVNIVAYIIGDFGLTPRQFEVADVIRNDSVNVFDLVADVNMIYGIALPTPAPPSPDQRATVALDYDDMSAGMTQMLTIRSELPGEVAGVQMQLNYDPAVVSFGTPTLTEDSDNGFYGVSSRDNGNGSLKLLIYNFSRYDSGDFMQAGKVDLVQIPITAHGDILSDDRSRIRLTEALLANSMAGAISVDGIDAPLPTTFALAQNYPNPFNPATTIEFTVGLAASGQSAQQVKLDIFNILGQRVVKLIDSRYSTGSYQVVWDATDNRGKRVATGIYLYRLTVGSEQETKKMLFLK